ncbi:MAG: BrnT family toxin [bacterium]
MNKKKHGISFVEAATAFSDENGFIIADPDHSDDEDRFILLGMSWSLRILVVNHCYRHSSEVIRIISARKANKAERAQYGAG